ALRAGAVPTAAGGPDRASGRDGGFAQGSGSDAVGAVRLGPSAADIGPAAVPVERRGADAGGPARALRPDHPNLSIPAGAGRSSGDAAADGAARHLRAGSRRQAAPNPVGDAVTLTCADKPQRRRDADQGSFLYPRALAGF